MNFRLVINLISYLIVLEGVSIAFSAGVSSIMKDPLRDTLMLLACGILAVLSGLAGVIFTRKQKDATPGFREGFAVVTFGWLLISIFGAIPFVAVTRLQWYDALFETISGFTTTGASVIDNKLKLWDGTTLSNGIESLSYGILFWRSLTHWIGGMGIVVFSLAILPVLGIGGQTLYNAEVPGVKTRSDQFTPRIASTAKILCLVYLGLTLLETLLLFFGGMTLFDAVCHSFATISTGGFSTKNTSIAYFTATTKSYYIELVITIFMFLAGCNIILHFQALTGMPLKDYLNEEFRTFALILLGATLIIGTYLYFSQITDSINKTAYHHNATGSFMAALFQSVSIATTTGFASANYADWPVAAGTIIFILMLMGGCGGSTSGGIKCMRIILLCKFSLSELRRNIFPHALQNIRLNGTRLESSTINRVLGFLLIYMVTGLVFLLLLTLCSDMDLMTAISASVTCIGNVGPGFGKLAPDQSFSWMEPAAKLLLAVEMLIGRLELYTVLIFFLPSFWKR
ncbi:MAG: TrkH family potassium uptake protein [Lentisphaeria bacterium]|nr:TrkH family potassium uptake protein [Lentisphaeria bacterium]